MSAESEGASAPVQRKIILHYHLFKNGGTSLDETLAANFPDTFVTREFGGLPPERNAGLSSWINEEQNAVVFSSHTANLPLPEIPGVTVFPVMFFRHPIDRIASAYLFEAKQVGRNNFGAKLARSSTFAEYVSTRLSIAEDVQCRNFHMDRLAAMYPDTEGSEIRRAMRALHTLPFVGILERFSPSIERLNAWLAPHFPGFAAQVLRANVAPNRAESLEARLEQVRLDLGPEVHARLLEANQADLALYEAACKLQYLLRIFPGSRPKPQPPELN